MHQILKIGQTIQIKLSGMMCKVKQFLGSGTQGEVYRASLGGKDVALKWYFPQWATNEQRAVIETLIKKGPPSRNFLWPMELVSASGVKGFGYIMPLRGKHYKSIVDLMKGRADPSFSALTTSGF